MQSISKIIFRLVIIVVVFLAIQNSIFAVPYTTSLTTNTTQPSIALDPASGNPQIGDFGSIGSFNGRLNYTMPLLEVGGRGNAGYTIALDLNRNWIFEHNFDEYYENYPDPNHLLTRYTILTTGEWWQQGGLKTGPGVVVPRFNPGPQPVCSSTTINYFTETSFTFASPDGSEITLLSAAYPSGVSIQCITYGGSGDDPDHPGVPDPRPGTYNPVSLGNVFTSVDGSGIKFITDQAINMLYTPVASGFLYFPNGTRYRIDNGGVSWIEDRNGNRTSFSSGIIDSNGRPINIARNLQNSEYGLHDEISYQGLNGATQKIIITYKQLGDVLRAGETLKTDHELFGYLPCPSSSCPPTLINPTVVSSVIFPGNLIYRYQYNSYEELARVETPQGTAFEYDWGGSLEGGDERGLIQYPAPLGGNYPDFFRQVLEKRVYENGETGNSYDFKTVIHKANPFPINTYNDYPDMTFTRTISSFGQNNTLIGIQKHKFWGHPLEPSPKPESGETSGPSMYPIWWKGRNFEKSSYGSDGVTLLRRNLVKWTSETQSGINIADARIAKQITIAPEGNLATAVLQEVQYDNNGNYDPNYFSHLNVKKSKAYNYKVVDLNTAKNADFTTILNLFGENDLASISETDYLYTVGYKERHILGLAVETRILNPRNPNDPDDILARSQIEYDEQNQYYSMINYGSTVGYEAPTGNHAHLRANATTLRNWDKDANTWIETHTQFDNFGNVRKVWDLSGNTTRFVETEYSPDYYYAYPTKVISPAPDPAGTHGTTETSTVERTYDSYTGLPLTVKDEFGQIVATEYESSRLRPTRTYAVNFTAPENQTEYGDTPGNLFVKSKKQIDTTNWDEATTFTDNLGRTIKTEVKDSQGNVFTETEYDNFGRVKRTTNPYRSGETKLWSKPRYDELGRAVESYTPAPDGQTGASLGITSYSISDVANFVGTVVTSTDASGRKLRSITNALGQLIRVDEATATGGTETADLGSLSSPNQATYYTYNEQGKMVKVQQGNQNRYFKYDSLGRLIRVKQPEQEPNDNIDMPDSYNTSGKWSAAFKYNALGDLQRATDANGVNIINEYDQAKRVTKRCYTNPNIVTTATNCGAINTNDLSANTPTVEYFYDGFMALNQPPTASPNLAKGKLTRVTSSISDTRYTQFDNLGRLLQMQQITDGQTYTSSYEYNFAGALIKETYPSGRVVKNEFKPDGDLLRVYGQANTNAAEKTYINGFSYTASGNIERMRLGNGRWETAKFNSRLQLTELGLGYSAADASLWKVNYEYGEIDSNGNVDANKNTGNIAQQTLTFAGLANPIVQTYKYDSLYRLTEAKETVNNNPSWTQNWSYDRYGNRLSFAQNIGGITNNQTPTIDSNTNRFAANQNFTYDKNGNITADIDPATAAGRSFTFNGENKQSEIKDANGAAIGKYFYDGEGKRVKKVTDTEITVFVYSSGKLVAEYSTQTIQNPTIKYLIEDHLGTPRIITDGVGNVVNRRDFMPFGEDLTTNVGGRSEPLKYGTSADNIRQKFTGYQKDTETSLDFAEARMYNNQHGRFTAVDPLLASGKSANPQTFNRYVYCLNRPSICKDPTGLVGDYYDRNGVWIGDDGKNDGKLYLADVTTREQAEIARKNGTLGGISNAKIYVTNIEKVSRKRLDEIINPPKKENSGVVAPAAVDTSDKRFNNLKGEPNTWEPNNDGYTYYDDKGLPRLEIDYHDESAGNPHYHEWDWETGQNPQRSEARPIPEEWLKHWDQEDESGRRNYNPFYFQGIQWDLFGRPLEVVEPNQPTIIPGAVPINEPPVPMTFPWLGPIPSGTSFPQGSPVVAPQTVTPAEPLPVFWEPIIVF